MDAGKGRITELGCVGRLKATALRADVLAIARVLRTSQGVLTVARVCDRPVGVLFELWIGLKQPPRRYAPPLQRRGIFKGQQLVAAYSLCSALRAAEAYSLCSALRAAEAYSHGWVLTDYLVWIVSLTPKKLP